MFERNESDASRLEHVSVSFTPKSLDLALLRNWPSAGTVECGLRIASLLFELSRPLVELVAAYPKLQRNLRRRLLSLLEQTNRGELGLFAEPLSLALHRRRSR